MELRDYLRIVRRRWLLLLGTIVACMALAAGATTQMTKQYSSSAQVFVSTTTSDSSSVFQGSQFSAQRVASYADVVGSVQLAQQVVDKLGLKMKATDLTKEIQAAVVPDTVLLKITVTDSNAKQARDITAAVVDQLQTLVNDLETPPGKKVPILKATVVDAPNIPTAPVSPKPTRNLALGLVVGLMLGIGIALLREILDTTVKRIQDIDSLVDVPVLSTLAYDSDVQKHPLTSTLPANSPRTEAFKVLRTNLAFIDVDHSSKAFVISSSVPGEGKTTTAVNAAIAMAGTAQRVLLIDGDLRRPQVAGLLRLEQAVGLTTALVGSASLNEVIQLHRPSGLHVLTSGRLPPNPAELLQSKAMSELLVQVRNIFDVVIIDAPPLLPVADAAVLAAQTDGSVVVVHYGKTTKDQLKEAVDRLEAVHSPPLGVIVNMVPAAQAKEYGYGYSYASFKEPSNRQIAKAAKQTAKAQHTRRTKTKPGR